jgi:hypothetical protein
MAEFKLQTYFDETNSLISLGPFFGGDADGERMRSLESRGLAYVDDFFLTTLTSHGIRLELDIYGSADGEADVKQ